MCLQIQRKKILTCLFVSVFTHFLCLCHMYDKHGSNTGDMWFCLGGVKSAENQPDEPNGWDAAAAARAAALLPSPLNFIRSLNCRFLSAHVDEITKTNTDQMSGFDVNGAICTQTAALWVQLSDTYLIICSASPRWPCSSHPAALPFRFGAGRQPQ